MYLYMCLFTSPVVCLALSLFVCLLSICSSLGSGCRLWCSRALVFVVSCRLSFVVLCSVVVCCCMWLCVLREEEGVSISSASSPVYCHVHMCGDVGMCTRGVFQRVTTHHIAHTHTHHDHHCHNHNHTTKTTTTHNTQQRQRHRTNQPAPSCASTRKNTNSRHNKD